MTQSDVSAREWVLKIEKILVHEDSLRGNNYELNLIAQGQWIERSETVPVIEKSAYEALTNENKKLRDMRDRIIAESHSWIITQETGAILKPVHDKYREIALEALGEK